jgi:tetratricopeptide (TPR) repeat protein
MGLVYRAYDHAMHRDVAVKVPLGRWEYDRSGARHLVRFVESPRAKQDLVNEVRNWIGLVHPHVVRAFDLQDDESTDYLPAILMDLCDGGSLASLIYRQDGLDLAEGLDVAVQVCWAMEYVHECGLLHLDLKSQNVLLARERNGRLGKTLVTDLGLVRAMGPRGVEPCARTSDLEEWALWVTVSQTGGTPSHMPPEQWESGGRVGPGSDVYAFGVMLYELFCRRLPFAGGNELRRWKQAHREQPVPEPRAWNKEITTVLSELMQQCLAKQAEMRPKAGFGEIAAVLASVYQTVTGRPHRELRLQPSQTEISRVARQGEAAARIRLGNGCQRRAQFAEASQVYAEAVAILNELGDMYTLATVLGNQAILLLDKGDQDAALDLLMRQADLCREVQNVPGLIASLSNQANIHLSRRQFESATNLYMEAERLCREIQDDNLRQAILGNLGVILKNRNQLDQALARFQEQEQLCLKLSNKEGLQSSWGNQGIVLALRGDFDGALRLYQRQEILCREIGNLDDLQKNLGNQGVLLLKQKQFGAAMPLFKEQEALCRRIDSRISLQLCLGYQGAALQAQQDYDGAMALYVEQERLCRELRNHQALLTCLSRQRDIHAKREHFNGVMGCLKEEELVLMSLADDEGLAACSSQMAICALMLGDELGARGAARRAIELKQRLGLQIEDHLYHIGQQ